MAGNYRSLILRNGKVREYSPSIVEDDDSVSVANLDGIDDKEGEEVDAEVLVARQARAAVASPPRSAKQPDCVTMRDQSLKPLPS